MGIEYIAVIAEEDYKAFKILVTTTLPGDYEMWLRVRDRGKLRAANERSAQLGKPQATEMRHEDRLLPDAELLHRGFGLGRRFRGDGSGSPHLL